MSTNLYVNVWTDASQTALGDIEQTLVITTLTGANQTTAAVAQNGTLSTKRVRLFAEVSCFVTWGTGSPDATGSNRVALGAENPEYFTVPVGTKFSAITR